MWWWLKLLHGLDQRLRLRRIPLRRPRHCRNLAAVLTDQHRRRQAQNLAGLTQCLKNLGLGIGIAGQALHADLIEKGIGFIEPRRINIDRHDFEIGRAKLGLKAIESRHFLTAGDAPGGPKVQKQGFAGKILQARVAAIRPVEADLRHRLWSLRQDQRRHFSMDKRLDPLRRLAAGETSLLIRDVFHGFLAAGGSDLV